MLKRLFSLLVLIGLIAGGTWYLLRRPPGKEIEELRAKITTLLHSKSASAWRDVTTEEELAGRDLTEFAVRLELIRAASDRILELNPRDPSDLEQRGVIEELAGNPIGALERYDRVLARDRPQPQIHLRRARVLRRLGHMSQAKGAAASVVDEFPYESNYELARLYMQSFQPVDAYNAFRRAQDLARNEDQALESLEGVVESLEQLIAAVRVRTTAEGGTGASRPTRELESLRKLEAELAKAIDDAVARWRQRDGSRRTRPDFVEAQLRIFELLSSRPSARGGDAESHEAFTDAMGGLLGAVGRDEERQFIPLYLVIGSVNLRLAQAAGIDEPARMAYFSTGIRNLGHALTWNLAGGSGDFADENGWNLPPDTTRAGAELHRLLRVAEALLGTSESWRIRLESRGGATDELRVAKRIEQAIEAGAGEPLLRSELRATRALALLAAGDSEGFEKELAALMDGADTETRRSVAMRAARTMATRLPAAHDELLAVLDAYVMPPGDGEESAEIPPHLGEALDVLREARVRVSLDEAQADRGGRESIERITRKIRDIVTVVAEKATSVGQVLMASKVMATMVDLEASVQLLEATAPRFDNPSSIRFVIASVHLDRAYREGSDESLMTAFESFLALAKERPFDAEVVSRLSLVAKAVRQKPAETRSKVLEIVGTVLGARGPAAEPVSALIISFFSTDYAGALKIVQAQPDLVASSPFLCLLAGIANLEKAAEIVRGVQSQTLAARGNLDALRQELATLRQLARKHFEAGLVHSPDDIAIQLELAKMDLNSLSSSEAVPPALETRTRDLVQRRPDVPQAHFMHAAVKRRQCEQRALAGAGDLKRSLVILSEMRASLRKAIQTDPAFTAAHLELAETYVLPWIMERRSESRAAFYFGRFGAPDFEKAITILESAPQSVQVFGRLAEYFRAVGRTADAVAIQEKILEVSPSETLVGEIVRTYLDVGEFEAARTWLAAIDPNVVKLPGLDCVVEVMYAHVASAEAENLEGTRHSALEQEQIRRYEAALALCGERADVVNNLAYLLAKSDRAEEALRLIEGLRDSIRLAPGSHLPALTTTVEETYAWCLFKSDELKRSIEIYRTVCGGEAPPEFRLNFAEVLCSDKSYEEARTQLDPVERASERLTKMDQLRLARLKGAIERELQAKFDRQFQFRPQSGGG